MGSFLFLLFFFVGSSFSICVCVFFFHLWYPFSRKTHVFIEFIETLAHIHMWTGQESCFNIQTVLTYKLTCPLKRRNERCCYKNVKKDTLKLENSKNFIIFVVFSFVCWRNFETISCKLIQRYRQIEEMENSLQKIRISEVKCRRTFNRILLQCWQLVANRSYQKN